MQYKRRWGVPVRTDRLPALALPKLPPSDCADCSPEYVQVKPILALAIVILKAAGKYNEGDLRANSGYLYVSIVYNFSICLALYCLAIFWMCVNDDLKPFR